MTGPLLDTRNSVLAAEPLVEVAKNRSEKRNRELNLARKKSSRDLEKGVVPSL